MRKMLSIMTYILSVGGSSYLYQETDPKRTIVYTNTETNNEGITFTYLLLE